MRIGRIVKSVAATIVLLGVALCWLIGTSAGLGTVVGLASQWLPGVGIASCEGTLFNARLEGVTYKDAAIDVTAKRLSWTVSVDRLFVGQVDLPRLEIEEARLNVTGSTKEEESEIRLERLALNARYAHERLTVSNLVVQRPHVRLGSSPTTEQNALSLESLSTVIQNHVQQLSLPTLPFTFEATNWSVRQLQWDPGIEIYVALGRLRATPQKWTIEAFDMIDQDDRRLRLQASIQPIDAWPIEMRADAEFALDGQRQTVELLVSGEVKGVVSTSVEIDGSADALVRAQVELAADNTPLLLIVTNADYANESIRVTNGQLAVFGTLNDYRVDAQASVRLPDRFDNLEADLSGRGSLSELNLERARVRRGAMSASVHGRLDWEAQRAQWDLTLAVNALDARAWGAPVSTSVSGGGRVSGRWQAGSFDVNLDKWVLGGRYNDETLAVRLLEGTIKPTSIRLPSLEVQVGTENRLKGRVVYEDGRLDIEQTLEAGRLTQLYPEVQGRLKGTVRVVGAPETMSVEARLLGENLGWRTYAIDRFDLRADIPDAGKTPGFVRLDIPSVRGDFGRVRDVRLALDGTRHDHALTVQAASEPLRLTTSVRGALAENERQWNGKVRRLRLETPEGPLTLKDETALSVTTDGAIVGPHCWQHDRLTLCAKEPIQAASKAIRLGYELERVDVSLLNVLTKGAYRFEGVLQGALQLHKATPEQLRGHFELTNETALVATKPTGEKTSAAYRVDAMRLVLDAENEEIRGKLHLTPEASEPIEADVVVVNVTDEPKATGRFKAPNVLLDAFGGLFGMQDAVKGRLAADLTLNGTLKEPMLHGRIDVDALSVKHERLPVRVKEGSLHLGFDGRSSRLDGRLTTSRGYLSLTGQGQWPTHGEPNLKLGVQGERFFVRYGNVLWATLSPDLTLTVKGKALDLKGEVLVPSGRISLAQLPPDSVGVSSDERLTDAQWQPLVARQDEWAVTTDVTVRLGERVRFNAFGLRARMIGSMTAKQTQRGLSLHGQVELKDGKYKAYGQDLQIRKGKLLFSGLPQEPMLDIEAVRNPDSTADGVVAGLRVNGTASSPSVQVFSNPTMSESRALSYLLSGQGPGGSGSDSAMVTSALVGLGASKSGQLIGQIGNAFGIRRLGLDTEGAGQEAKVVLSGYIHPDVQIKYGVGLFDSLAVWTLRYRMMPQLFLEAVSGTEQAIDLLYRFEF